MATVEPPKIELKFPSQQKQKQAMAQLAATALFLTKNRMYPPKGATKNVHGAAVKPLSPKYRAYKSGKVRYSSKRARQAATTRRAQSGPGKGPLAIGEGGRRIRLSPRSPAANQQLTGATARSFTVLRSTHLEARLGFTTARAREVAGYNQDRNNSFGFTANEQRRILVDSRQKLLNDVQLEVSGAVRLEL